MLKEEFRKWAKYACREYDKEPWSFLRELAQNSRDANARQIQVKGYLNHDGMEILEFEDDGKGMTFEHARRYLFCLYASSKERNSRYAGKYGIGFWSVLSFAPEKIIIESRTKKEEWGIEIHSNFETVAFNCNLNHCGTRVTLIRKSQFENEGEFKKKVEDALVKYCKYLRRNDREFSNLPVIFEGKNITRQIRLQGPISMSFRHGATEGSVTLSKTPSVEVYARGLFVWKGTAIDELRHTFQKQKLIHDEPAGLFPVFILNGNNLNVNLSRRTVIDDKELEKVRNSACRALQRLINLHLEKTFPRNPLRKSLDIVFEFFKKLQYLPYQFYFSIVLSIIIAFLIIKIIHPVIFNYINPYKTVSPPNSVFRFEGAVIDSPDELTNNALTIEYNPPIDAYFRVLSAETYDTKKGFVANIDYPIKTQKLFLKCHQPLVSVKLNLKTEEEKFTLPVPAGYIVEPESIKFEGKKINNSYITQGGDTIVENIHTNGLWEYNCCPIPPDFQPENEYLTKISEILGKISFPDNINQIIEDSVRLTTEQKVLSATLLTQTLLKYDNSIEGAQIYKQLKFSDNYLDFVLKAGIGDCDVMNGLNAIFLRLMKIPARLAIGLIGKNGKTEPAMHAWTEYYDNGWKFIDATAPIYEEPKNENANSFKKTTEHISQNSTIDTNFFQKFQKIVVEDKNKEPLKNNEIPNLGKKKSSSKTFFLITAVPLTILLTIFLLFAFLKHSKNWEHIESISDKKASEEILAKLILSASSHPHFWRGTHRLWFHEILPLLNNKRISLNNAIKLSKKKMLFSGSPGNPLAMDALKAGSHVLDKTHKIFGEFISHLSGVIDLDTVHSIKPISLQEGSKLKRIIDRVQYFLDIFCKPPIILFLTENQSYTDIFEVDISSIHFSSHNKFPKRFIALNSSCQIIKKCLKIFDDSPRIATYMFISDISRKSRLLNTVAEKIRYYCARKLFDEVMQEKSK